MRSASPHIVPVLALALLLMTAAEGPVRPGDGELTPTDRVVTAAAVALGAVAGAVLGSASALAVGASRAGFNDDAHAVPELALPPTFAALAAGAAGSLAGGSDAGWAGGVGALLGGGIATLGIALVMPADGPQQQDARFVALLLAPAVAAALVSAAAAAVLLEPASLAPMGE